MKNPIFFGAKLLLSSHPLASKNREDGSADARLRVNALVSGVNSESDQFRSRMRQLGSEDPSPDAPNSLDQNDQVSALEGLVHSVRQASEHLVIASLDARARENQATQAHQRQSEFLSMLAHELRILLIDDSADTNLTLREILQKAGHAVNFALDGEAGLRMSSLALDDVICCDIGQPGLSGYGVAQQRGQTKSTARLIAISGYGQPEPKERALKAGFDHYLCRPMSGHDLWELIADDER